MIKKHQDILIFITILILGPMVLALTITDKDARHAFDFIGMHKSEIIKINNDDIVPIRISKNNSNQILISGEDKIKSIKNDSDQLEILKSNSSCNKEVWLHYKDDADKNIYCMRFLKQDEPATALITTEKDVTYKLLLVPTSGDSKTIMITEDKYSGKPEFRIY